MDAAAITVAPAACGPACGAQQAHKMKHDSGLRREICKTEASCLFSHPMLGRKYLDALNYAARQRLNSQCMFAWEEGVVLELSRRTYTREWDITFYGLECTV